MTKKQKEFIAKAKPKTSEMFKGLYIADSGKAYDGFWGKNGYNSMVIIGETTSGELETLSDYSDVICCFAKQGFSADIDRKNRMLHIWFDEPVQILDVLSACILYEN